MLHPGFWKAQGTNVAVNSLTGETEVITHEDLQNEKSRRVFQKSYKKALVKKGQARETLEGNKQVLKRMSGERSHTVQGPGGRNDPPRQVKGYSEARAVAILWCLKWPQQVWTLRKQETVGDKQWKFMKAMAVRNCIRDRCVHVKSLDILRHNSSIYKICTRETHKTSHTHRNLSVWVRDDWHCWASFTVILGTVWAGRGWTHLEGVLRGREKCVTYFFFCGFGLDSLWEFAVFIY